MAVRRNYCMNPSFEANTTSWGTSATFAGSRTLTKTDGVFVYGSSSARWQMTGGVGDSAKAVGYAYITSTASFEAGDAARASLYIKGTVSGCTLSFLLLTKTSAGATLDTATVNITLTTEWQRVSVLIASARANTSYAQLILRTHSDLDAGDTVDAYIDGVLIEKSADLGDYFDGSTPGGHWSDVANASASDYLGRFYRRMWNGKSVCYRMGG